MKKFDLKQLVMSGSYLLAGLIFILIISNSCGNKSGNSADTKFEPISFTPEYYLINGKPAYLYSGEFHYFRVPKKDWKRRMQLFKEAGGNCLATYVPWIIHEPEEGKILFGDTDIRDLEEFIKTAQEVGLYLIVRPGPYQYSELRNAGVPEWLTTSYPQTRAQNFDGTYATAISYVHPIVLEKTAIWFEKVCSIFEKYTTDKGGPVAMVQLDNESAGIHLWESGMDYNKESMGFGKTDGRYTLFLKKKYGSIEKLNLAYNTKCKAFENAGPFDYRTAKNVFELREAKDYTDFYFSTIADYFQELEKMVRKSGIKVPLVHNSYNTNASVNYLEAIKRLGNSQFLLGVDHYYNLAQGWGANNPDPQWAIRVFQSLETLRMFGYPPTVFEFPGGSCSDWPPIMPRDVEAAYMMQLGFGMKGSNYYIFTGGPNPLNFGTTSDDYDYNAAVASDGAIRPLYETEKRIGTFVKENTWLYNSRRVYDCRIAYDLKIARSTEYWKNKTGFLATDPELYTFSQKGMLNSLFCGSYSPELCDLESESWMEDTGNPLIVLSSSCMAASSQQKVVDFLRKEGKVVLCPVIPEYDENFGPCTILKEFLGSPQIEINNKTDQRISFQTVKNVMSNEVNYITVKMPVNASMIGEDENNKMPVAWKSETENKGTLIFLGIRWQHQMREHIRMMDEVLNDLGIKKVIRCSNQNLFTSLRTNGKKTTLFIMNLYTSPMQGNIDVYSGDGKSVIKNVSVDLEPMKVQTVDIENYK